MKEERGILMDVSFDMSQTEVADARRVEKPPFSLLR